MTRLRAWVLEKNQQLISPMPKSEEWQGEPAKEPPPQTIGHVLGLAFGHPTAAIVRIVVPPEMWIVVQVGNEIAVDLSLVTKEVG